MSVDKPTALRMSDFKAYNKTKYGARDDLYRICMFVVVVVIASMRPCIVHTKVGLVQVSTDRLTDPPDLYATTIVSQHY